MATWHIIGKITNGGLEAAKGTYAEAHDQPLADIVGATPIGVGQAHHGGSWFIYRGGVFYDTSILGGASVISAALHIAGYYTTNPPQASFDLCVVSGDDLDEPLVAADYGELLDDTTPFGSTTIPIGGIGWDSYTSIALDAAGIAKIDPSGLTKFGLRSLPDINSAPPTVSYEHQLIAHRRDNASEIAQALPATDITRNSAILHGHIDINPDYYPPHKLVIECSGEGNFTNLDTRFRWHKHGTTDYHYTDWNIHQAWGEDFPEEITGLEPGTIYHFRAQCRIEGVVYITGITESFTTLPRCSNLEDGYIGNYGFPWDTVHGADSGLEIEDTDVSVVVLAGYFEEFEEFAILRAFLYFDTSDIPPEATIISARLALYPEDVFEAEAGYATLHAVEGVQAVPLELEDFGRHLDKVVSGGSIAFADWVPDSYNEIELNATALSWINKGGLTKFCLRVAADKDDTPPTLDGDNGVVFCSAETGPDFCPKLIVTYELPPPVVPPKGNIVIDQLIYQHAERMARFR